MRPSFMFASDLHGDVERMNELVKKAIELECSKIILGGDLFRVYWHDPINAQRTFLTEEVQPIFEKFPGEVHTIFGNNDIGLVSREFPKLAPKLRVFDGSSFMLDEGVEVVGISHVPVTPFPLKDWERKEATSGVNPMSRVDGFCSWEGEMKECIIRDDRTMMDELTGFGRLSDKIVISHAPPWNTVMDLGWSGDHLGSSDLRTVIEDDRPMAVLSGHIHEAPKRSGKMVEVLGDTWIANPGSHSGISTLILGEFDDCLKLIGFREDAPFR
jgi:Icc-related predicted phosphoesterase